MITVNGNDNSLYTIKPVSQASDEGSKLLFVSMPRSLKSKMLSNEIYPFGVKKILLHDKWPINLFYIDRMQNENVSVPELNIQIKLFAMFLHAFKCILKN